MKTKILTIAILLFTSGLTFSQQNYDDFEGNKFQYFGNRNGTLDSIFSNPGPDLIDSSLFCAQYIRTDTVPFDNIKMYPIEKLVDVTPYATNSGNPPKIKMKLYSTAPVGTKVEIQLGNKGDNNYPSGVHSIYKDSTTTQNEWEELSFGFTQIPFGSLVGPTNVDKVTLFFAPNTFTKDTFYFDDLTGPALISSIGIGVEQGRHGNNFSLQQNIPNPASDKTAINYSLKSNEHVSLKLYNSLGMEVLTLVEQNQSIGDYRITLNTADFSAGTYFYILQAGEFVEAKKMIVVKL